MARQKVSYIKGRNMASQRVYLETTSAQQEGVVLTREAKWSSLGRYSACTWCRSCRVLRDGYYTIEPECKGDAIMVSGSKRLARNRTPRKRLK